VRAGQVGCGDNVEHPKGLFLGEEEEEEAGEEVEGLAVAYFRAVEGESAENAAEGAEQGGFFCDGGGDAGIAG